MPVRDWFSTRWRGPTDAAAWRVALADGALVLLVFAVPHAINSDGIVRFYNLTQLLSGGGWSNSPYSLVGPLFSTPLFLIGKVAYSPIWWCAQYNALLLVIGVAMMGMWLRRVAGRETSSTFVLLLALASMFPYHIRNYFGETFTALSVATGLLALAAGRLTSGSVLVALGVANTPATAVGLLAATAALVWDTRRLRSVAPLALACVLIAAESWIRRGGPFVSGYEGNHGVATILPYSGRSGFSYPLLFGALSIVFSFGKGLLFFAPGLVLPLGREVPERVRAWWRYSLWFLAGCVLVYSKWWAWWGGLTWGPRFFLFASIPAALTMAAARNRYRALGTSRLVLLVVALALSTWVAIDGATFELANLDICRQDKDALAFLCWYVPEFSPLWRPFVAASSLSPTQLLFGWYCAAVGAWLVAPLLVELARRAGKFVNTEVRSRLRGLGW